MDFKADVVNRRRFLLILLSCLIAAVSSLGTLGNNDIASAASKTKNVLVLKTPSYIPTPPTGGSDEYRCFILDPKLVKSSFLQSVSITPTNTHVSHHGILYRLPAEGVAAAKTLDSQSTEKGWPCFGDSGIPGAGMGRLASSASWISFWAPGGNFKQFPAGTGMKMDAKDQFILQIHFHLMAGMSPESASMNVTLKYATKRVKQLNTMLLAAPIELPCSESETGPLCDRKNAIADLKKRTIDTALFTNAGLQLKCGGDPRNPIPSSVTTCKQILLSPTNIYGTTGHMHQLGKSIEISIQDGVTEKVTILTSQTNWDFDNQKTNWVKTPVSANAGDTLKVTCTYDVKLRSLLPAFKDQPPRYVVWGEGSNDEMCLAIINYVD
ncbi:unannotated protein [freshwater metagenome]|uniref:Unannotated protein n=1 Tax=freshwater metagenome TaxID=449393 RepID=A0A6J7HTN6_9ZZZZ|nr:hypothetical protein [Actinomycetota bacterium]